MTGADILNKLLKYSGLNGKSFSEKIGLIRPQSIYDIQNGKTRNISPSMANKIISVFPEVNRVWLLTGEGKMLKAEDKKASVEDDIVMSREIFALLQTQVDTICSQQRTIERLSAMANNDE